MASSTGLRARAVVKGIVAVAMLMGSGTAMAGVFPNGVNLQPSYYNGGYPNFG